MSEITITPNFDDKTATIEGVASAGEKVLVTLKNCSTRNSSTLRLRVLFVKKMLAVYPVPPEKGKTADVFTVSGSDLTCVLNLCTDTAMKVFKRLPELDVMFILDDIGSSVRQMYFRDFHTILGWPQEITDNPIDLSTYADRMDAFAADVAEMRSDIDDAVESMNATLEGKVDKVNGKGLSTVDVTPEMVAGFASAETLANHIADIDIHLRSGERVSWSGKVSPAEIANKQDIIVSGGYLYVPRGGDFTPQTYHRAQIVYDNEIGMLVLDISPAQYTYSDGTFTEVQT